MWRRRGGDVLGYTAANDVSSRESQFAQSQWSYSKGFDGACPIGELKRFPRRRRSTESD